MKYTELFSMMAFAALLTWQVMLGNTLWAVIDAVLLAYWTWRAIQRR